jgi:hypothetical protein
VLCQRLIYALAAAAAIVTAIIAAIVASIVAAIVAASVSHCPFTAPAMVLLLRWCRRPAA